MGCDQLRACQGENFSAVINWTPNSLGNTVTVGVSASLGRYPNFFMVPSTITADTTTSGQYDIALSEVSVNTIKWVEGANKLAINLLDANTNEVIDVQTMIVHVRSAQHQ